MIKIELTILVDLSHQSDESLNQTGRSLAGRVSPVILEDGVEI